MKTLNTKCIVVFDNMEYKFPSLCAAKEMLDSCYQGILLGEPDPVTRAIPIYIKSDVKNKEKVGMIWRA